MRDRQRELVRKDECTKVHKRRQNEKSKRPGGKGCSEVVQFKQRCAAQVYKIKLSLSLLITFQGV